MRILNEDYNPRLQDNLLNGQLSIFYLVENIRKGNISFDDRSSKVKERAYYLMTQKTDGMTVETAETYFDAIKQDPLSVELFVHALTGDYRGKKFMDGAMRLAEFSTDKIIADSQRDPQTRANTQDENTELLNRLTRRLGYSVLDYVSENDKEYLLSRCNPEKLVKDSRDSVEAKITWGDSARR